jgi:hypothetical protein
MKQIIKNISLLMIVGLLILATGGFSVYRHICHCAGELSSSVILEATCNHENPDSGSTCCDAEDTQSCCKDKSKKETKQSCHGDDCCQTSSQFLKINDSFQPGLEKLHFKPIAAVSALLCIVITEDVLSIPAYNINTSDLPPPDSGRQIVLSLHQLKLDPSLV